MPVHVDRLDTEVDASADSRVPATSAPAPILDAELAHRKEAERGVMLRARTAAEGFDD